MSDSSSANFSQTEHYLSITTPLGADKIFLMKIAGREAISELFHYQLTLMSSDMAVDFSQLVGKSATIKILQTDGTSRCINGIITRFSLLEIDEIDEIAYYEAELDPWLWLLTLHADCRIFQTKTVPDIVTGLLQELGYSDVKNSLTATYTARDYCVQYRETTYNFIARLLEEEGIFYYFQHVDGKHTMVLADSSSAHVNCPVVSTVKFKTGKTRDLDDNVVTSCTWDQRVTSNAFGIDAFNFLTPSTDLYVKMAGSKSNLAINDYPSRHADTSAGETIAKVGLAAREFPASMLRGEGRCRTMAAGYKFTMSDHNRSDLNAEYVLYAVVLDASPEGYTARFEAFPSAVLFRPLNTAVKPRIPSTQTAIVVGKAGEEIWVDKYGRVKVQFHWDRLGKKDENSSCWIRVAQGWAGKSWGMVFLPRIGQEVVVSFLEGDPDCPLVTGSVYNAEQTIPYTLPDDQTKSTIKSQTSKNGSGKFNEIRFEDKADSEEIYIHAQKDYKLEVENDVTRTIKNNETVTVTKDCSVTVNHDNTITIKNDRSRTVQEGNDTLTVSKGTRGVTVKGAETHTNNDTFTHTVDKDYSLTVKGNLTIEVTGDLSIKAKSITMQSSSADVTVKASTAMTLQSGTTLDVKSGTSLGLKSGTDFTGKSTTSMTLQSGIGLDIKATTTLNAEGLQTTVKGSAMGTVDGGGMLTVKGGLVKIN
jgi:type VI secretion system secreted protein VgrG